MPHKMLTEDEAMHLVAREVAKQRMGDIEKNVSEMERRFIALLSELKTQLANQTLLIKEQSADMKESSDLLKKEIEKDFASKIEVNDLSNKVDTDFEKLNTKVDTDFGKLNTKIDALWGRLTLIVTVVTATGLALQYLITISRAAGQ